MIRTGQGGAALSARSHRATLTAPTGPVAEQPKRARTPARCGVPRCARLGARSAPPVTTSSTRASRLRSESRPARVNCDVGHTGDRKRNGEENSLSFCATPRIIVSSHQ